MDDYQLALALQAQFDHELQTESFSKDSERKDYVNFDLTKNNSENPTSSSINSSPFPNSSSLVDSSWEMIDPSPNVHSLFIEFDKRFFGSRLQSVEVKWSKRMTLCAGLCCYQGRGGLCSIRLSEPLLKLRPRRDLVETLLHEMIHALLFVTQNNRDRDGHGPEFVKHMNRINSEACTNITIYHSFHDEVDSYRQHWWRCDGPCKERKPFYGYVKRSMNRAPSKIDFWWAEHQRSCGGTFIKIKEPENTKNKQKSQNNSEQNHKQDIRNLFKQNNLKESDENDDNKETHVRSQSFASNGVKLGSEDSTRIDGMRQIPGVGLVPIRKTFTASVPASNSSADHSSINRYLTTNNDKVKTKNNHVSKKNRSLQHIFERLSKTPPGTVSKISGFLSVSNPRLHSMIKNKRHSELQKVREKDYTQVENSIILRETNDPSKTADLGKKTTDHHPRLSETKMNECIDLTENLSKKRTRDDEFDIIEPNSKKPSLSPQPDKQKPPLYHFPHTDSLIKDESNTVTISDVCDINNSHQTINESAFQTCPICQDPHIRPDDMNDHIDLCLVKGLL